MKNIFSVIVGLSLVSSLGVAAQGPLLTVTPGTKTCEGHNVPQGAVANFSDKQVNLTTTGFGLRSKKVAIVNVKVYCAELMVSDTSVYVHDTASNVLASMVKSPASAIRLDFVGSFSAQQMKTAFLDAFNANHVDTSSPMIAAFLNVVSAGGNPSAGKTMTIAFDLIGGTIYYEDTNGKASSIKGDTNTTAQILSVWLGVPADSGLAALQKQLLGN